MALIVKEYDTDSEGIWPWEWTNVAMRVKEYSAESEGMWPWEWRNMALYVICLLLQEEQNASSSANYDVELLHPLEAHDEILLTGKWEQCNICIHYVLLINLCTVNIHW